VEKPTFLSSVDVLACEESLDGNEVLSSVLVFILVSEHDSGKGSSSTGIMNDFFHNSFDVPNRMKNELLTLVSRKSRGF
jgi:hypothetical protein